MTAQEQYGRGYNDKIFARVISCIWKINEGSRVLDNFYQRRPFTREKPSLGFELRQPGVKGNAASFRGEEN